MNPTSDHTQSAIVRWTAVLTVGLVMLGALTVGSGSAAGASTRIVAPQFTDPIQTWANEAKAPTPTSTVVVRKVFCNLELAAMACASYDSMRSVGTITMMSGLTGVGAQKIFLHELGHVFDGRHLYPRDRADVTRTLGFPAGTPWTGAAGAASPSEWFAEAASLCYLGWSPESLANYGFRFSYVSPQVQGVCSIMRRAVKQPAKEPMTFTTTLPPFQKFQSVTMFEPGTLSAKVTIGGRASTSNSSCTDQVRSTAGAVYVNTCGNRVSAWSFASSRATLIVRGVPAALPVTKAGAFSAVAKPQGKRAAGKRGLRR